MYKFSFRFKFVGFFSLSQMSTQNRIVRLRNGLEMPMLGLGTSLRGKAKIESEAFVESVKHAIEIGYRHIDTVNQIYFNRLYFTCG